MNAEPTRMTVDLPRRAKLIAGGAVVTMLALLMSMLGLLELQRRHVASQDRKMSRLLSVSEPVLRESRPLVDDLRPVLADAEPLLRESRPLVRSARDLVGPARRAALAVESIATQVQPLLARLSAREVTTVAESIVVGARTAIPVLEALRRELPRALPELVTLTESLNDGQRLVRLIDTSRHLLRELDAPVLRRMGRNALVAVPELVALQRSLLQVQVRTLEIQIQSLETQRSSLETQRDSLRKQDRALDILRRSLDIQRETLEHVRSLDRKTEPGGLPSP